SPATAGSLSGAPDGYRIELALSPARLAVEGQSGAGRHDGGAALLRTCGFGYVLADSIFKAACGGDSERISAGRCGRDRRRIRTGFYFELLYRTGGAYSASTQCEPLVWIILPCRAPDLPTPRFIPAPV